MDVVDGIIKLIKEVGFPVVVAIASLMVLWRGLGGFLNFLSQNNKILTGATTNTISALADLRTQIVASSNFIERSTEALTGVAARMSISTGAVNDLAGIVSKVDTKIGDLLKTQEDDLPAARTAWSRINTFLPPDVGTMTDQFGKMEKTIEEARAEIKKAIDAQADDTRAKLAAQIAESLSPVFDLVTDSQAKLNEFSTVTRALTEDLNAINASAQTLTADLKAAVGTLTARVIEIINDPKMVPTPALNAGLTVDAAPPSAA